MVRLIQAQLPSLSNIEEAESRLRKYFPPTPLEQSPGLSELLDREVYLKLETALPIRVFKLRGAMNKLLSLPESSLKKGVITASSGNHGFAIAYASRLFGVRATICVPENVNPTKLKAIREQGAEVVVRGKGYDETYESAQSESKSRGMTFVHAFNDPDIIAGQGTCGLEISRQLPDLDAVVVAIGGGGLISGISTAVKESLPGAKVFGAETVSIPSMYESVRAGQMVRVVPASTIADGMQAAIPGDLTFAAVSKYVDKIGLVTDPELEDAIFDLLSIARVLAEPAGASPLAAMKGPLRSEPGKKVVLVVSGGNISLDLLAKILIQRGKGTPRGS
ncbi:MAG TPA: threonine/serine dehydratase [Nitrososphaerales archaeon]|nr:threonine/serine dehydratase [Nitrososphaerales archaeon]